MARSSARKRQTTLDFSPMPSSSPGAAALSPQVRNRAAAVEYRGSSAKRRKIVLEDASQSAQVATLPTPRKSSQAQGNGSVEKDELYDITSSDDDDIIPVRPSQRPKVNTKQTRMGFGQPVLANGGHARAKRRIRGSGLFSSDPAKSAVEMSGSDNSKSDSEEEVSPPAPASSPPASARRSARAKGKAPVEDIDGNVTARRSKRTGKCNKPVVELSSEEEEEEEEEDELPSPSRLGNGKGANGKQDIGEAESSAGEMPVSSAVKPRRAKRPSKEEVWIVDDNKDVAEEPAKSSRRFERSGAASSKKARQESCIEDDEVAEPSPISSKRKRKQRKMNGTEDEDEEEVPSSKRLHRRKGNQQETEDLQEDLNFLKESSPPRSAPTPGKGARQSALDKLKQRRNGAKGSEPTSTQQRHRRALYDSDDDVPNEDDAPIGSPVSDLSDPSDDQDEEDDGELQELSQDPFPKAKGHREHAADMFYEDEHDAAFIASDDEGDDTLGAPDTALPLQFSNFSRMKASDLFKYVVEWLVQKKLNPAFQIKDEVYDIAFKKLNDEVRGLAGSKFTSSAWTQDFTRSLQGRPGISVLQTGADGYKHCEACNRKGHPATFEVRFFGRPYHPDTLEEVEDEEDSDGEVVVGGPAYDHLDREIPPEDRSYNLGRTCMANAQTAHALAHWRMHLYEYVVDFLRKDGHLTAAKIVGRDDWSTKRRRRYANEVVDEMEEKGEVRRVYRVYKAEIEVARQGGGSGGQGRYIGDGGFAD